LRLRLNVNKVVVVEKLFSRKIRYMDIKGIARGGPRGPALLQSIVAKD